VTPRRFTVRTVPRIIRHHPGGTALSSKWSGLACPDCGCMKMAACDSRRIAGGMLRIRQCQNPKCLRRVHTIEKLRSNRTWKAGAARAKKAGSPNRPG
jgi:hypothetical protein